MEPAVRRPDPWPVRPARPDWHHALREPAPCPPLPSHPPDGAGGGRGGCL